MVFRYREYCIKFQGQYYSNKITFSYTTNGNLTQLYGFSKVNHIEIVFFDQENTLN